MKIIGQLLLLLFNKVLCRKSNGYCLKVFCSSMGMAYIKLCQMLALQNIGNLFTEKDRLDVLSICYDVNPIPYHVIRKELESEYGSNLRKYFKHISKKPIGSASVSQVHICKLCTGEDVVLKIKRQDVMSSINKDVSTIRFLCKHFGWLVGVTNHATASAWDYYLKWLMEETDFRHEVNNIRILQRFADNVNNKVSETKMLIVPKVYEEYCTDNVIVMQYMPYKTINKIDDHEKIANALNSYIRQSFYALFNDIPVVYHGDMHPGNIFIDNEGNLGFLDMGLVFEINSHDANLTRQLFLSEWLKDTEKLSKILRPWFKGTDSQYELFKSALVNTVDKLPDKCVSSYFMDIVFLCLDVDLTPPYFLFCMAKAFVCLFGADSLYTNDLTCRDMLSDLVLEYIATESYSEGVKLFECFYNTILSAVVMDKDAAYKNASECLSKLHKAIRYTKGLVDNLK